MSEENKESSIKILQHSLTHKDCNHTNGQPKSFCIGEIQFEIETNNEKHWVTWSTAQKYNGFINYCEKDEKLVAYSQELSCLTLVDENRLKEVILKIALEGTDEQKIALEIVFYDEFIKYKSKTNNDNR